MNRRSTEDVAVDGTVLAAAATWPAEAASSNIDLLTNLLIDMHLRRAGARGPDGAGEPSSVSSESSMAVIERKNNHLLIQR